MTHAGSLERLRQDFRYGVRLLRLNPGFAATAILSLALGIAANTSIFTLTDQILLRLLPVQNPRELVQFRMEGGRIGSQNGDGLHTFSYPMYIAFRDRNTVFSGLTGQYTDRVSLLAGDRGEMIETGWVAGNFFQVLGVKPFIGRVLTAEDDSIGKGAPVVVIQYGFWQSRYGGREDILGSTVRLNGAPFTVVGVAAPEFGGTNAGLPTQLWAPVTARTALAPDWVQDLKNERYAWFYMFARMKPGVTLPQAEAAMRVLHDQRKQEELPGEFFAKFPDTKDRFLRQTLLLVPGDRGLSSLARPFERPRVVLQWLVRRAVHRRRIGAGHRVRERGRAAARACRGAPARDCHPQRTRRQPQSGGAAAFRRKHDSRDCRRSCGIVPQRLAGARTRAFPAVRSGVALAIDDARWPCPAVHDSRDPGDSGTVRPAAGISWLARHGGHAQG
jgi:hypothetical protein